MTSQSQEIDPRPWYLLSPALLSITLIDERPYAKGTQIEVCVRLRDCVVLPTGRLSLER